MDALDCEPSVNAEQIGVTVQEGVVTLAGRVGTLREKWAAETTARHVSGVRAIASELAVAPDGASARSDTAIAGAAVNALSEFGAGSESGSIQEDLDLDVDCAIVSDVNVLISGVDCHTGASLARLLHDCSLRKRGPFVVLDRPWMAGASPSDLRARLSAAASTGTVFIEEVAAMSPAMQSALLQVLDADREPLTDGPTCREVRIVAATTWNLFDAVRAHSFHADLFYRLNTVHLAFDAAQAPRSWVM